MCKYLPMCEEVCRARYCLLPIAGITVLCHFCKKEKMVLMWNYGW